MSSGRVDQGPARRRAAAAVVAVGLLAATFAGPGTGAATPARPATPGHVDRPAQDDSESGLKAEYDEVLGREADLIAEVERARAEQVRLNDELTALQEQVKAKEVELVGVQLELQAAQEKAAERAKARKRAEQRVDRAEERLRQQLVASYVNGGENQGMLEALLASENNQDIGSAIAYSKAVVGDTKAMVDELTEARAAQRKAERAAKRAEKAATTRRQEVDDATKFIAGARDNQKALVDQVNVELFNEATALREVQGRKAIVEGRINSINRTSDGVAIILADRQRNQPDWVPGDVEITSPMPGYQIGSEFGMRAHPILGITRLHAGGDIGAPSGAPIYAPADGVVVIAGERGGYGNTTVIDHGHSLGTLYGHQSRIAVREGQIVERGDLIGYVGSTGLSTGPHLHFETRIKGLPIDPKGVIDFDAPVDYGN